jgi:hypothetical protein
MQPIVSLEPFDNFEQLCLHRNHKYWSKKAGKAGKRCEHTGGPTRQPGYGIIGSRRIRASGSQVHEHRHGAVDTNPVRQQRWSSRYRANS